MAKKFDFEAARKAGYSDQEISSYFAESTPDFDVQGAMKSGYSPEEISEFISTSASEKKQPSRPKSLASAAGKGLISGLANVNPFYPGAIPIETGEKAFEDILPSQEKGPEKFLRRAGQLAPIAAMGPEGIVAKGLQVGAGALAGHLAEEQGAGQVGQAATEILGFTFPGLLKSLGMKVIAPLQKGIAKTGGEAAAKIARIKPEQVNEAVRESASRLGILEDLPLSAQVDNPIIQGTETKLMQSMTGRPLQEKLERTGEKLTRTYKSAGESLSSRENLLPSVVSQEASNVLKGMEEAAENSYRSLYSQASKALPEGAATTPKVGLAIHGVIDKTIDKLKSALGTPSKDALLNRLNRLKNSWSSNPELRAGKIPIKDLETLKQDINQVIKYETKGGVDKLLTALQGVTKEGIQSYGREFNKPYLNRFNEAERIFGENARTFRKNPLMRSLIKGERPEQIFTRMNSVKGINELEKVFGRTVEGKEAMDALKKYKLEDLLNKKVLDKNGEISWGKSAGMLKDAKTRDLVLKLVGPDQYKKLKDLAVVSSGVEQGFKKFANTSRTATTAGDMALLVGLPIQAVKQLFSGNILGAIKTTGYIFTPSMLAKLMANPKFVEAAIKTGKAGKGSNPSAFFKSAQEVAKITTAEMLKSQSTEETQQQPE
jgi:hypothetical protein